jgi:hypothetical protein
MIHLYHVVDRRYINTVVESVDDDDDDVMMMMLL